MVTNGHLSIPCVLVDGLLYDVIAIAPRSTFLCVHVRVQVCKCVCMCSVRMCECVACVCVHVRK